MNKFQLITNEVKKVINGKDRAVVTTLLALLTGGNILIEDIPGVGKTTMAVAFSKALGLEYGRVQFTPDTLPSDITGFAVYNKDTGKFTFNKGAVFCNLFLADELNRTSSRTQAALLEAMEERQVTVEGNTFKLEKPFSVIATQNPTGASGTQLLPDSQIDRFTVRLSMGYPDSDAECKMLLNRSGKNPLNSVNCIVSKIEFLEMQSEVQNVFVSDDMARYIVSLISATRKASVAFKRCKPESNAFTDRYGKGCCICRGQRLYCAERCAEYFYLHRKPQDNSQRKSLCIKKEQRRNSARNSQKNSKAEDLKMIRNIIIYLCLLTGTFLFSIFYYAWFSWFLFLTVVSIPIISLLLSLPFMIRSVRSDIEIFAKENVFIKDEFYIAISGKKKKPLFCPMLTLNIKSTNLTANLCENIKIRFSGTFTKPLIRQCNSLTQHCGQLDIVCKNGKVYDMLGIFFLPIRIKKRSFVRVLPKQQKPKIIPDNSNFTVTGYKPKPVGNSEIYELREYRHGDSLRNVHWKLSSKSDGLIVKEPNIPIIKNCLIMPFFGDNADENDVVFAKLMYVCRYMIKSIGICFACDRNGNPFEIRCENDILNYFSALYLNTESSFVADTNDFQHYNIFADREEVDLL